MRGVISREGFSEIVIWAHKEVSLNSPKQPLENFLARAVRRFSASLSRSCATTGKSSQEVTLGERLNRPLINVNAIFDGCASLSVCPKNCFLSSSSPACTSSADVESKSLAMNFYHRFSHLRLRRFVQRHSQSDLAAT